MDAIAAVFLGFIKGAVGASEQALGSVAGVPLRQGLQRVSVSYFEVL